MPEANHAPSYVAVGHIVAPHGIRGEVKVELMTDFPERYRPGSKLYLGDLDGVAVTPVQVTAARPHKNVMLVKLDTVPDRNAAELLRDQYLLIPEAQIMPLGEHENYVHDLVGLQVVAADGEVLGVLTEILFTRANDVYVVTGAEGELLLPALRDVVLQIDLAARRMTVALPEGLRTPGAQFDL